MSFRPTPARRLSGPVAGLVAVLLASGCGAGMKAQTYQQQTEADTTNDAVGTIAVRNLAVPAPQQGFVHKTGTDVPLLVTLVNQGEADKLLSASTPAASSVQIVGPSPVLEVPRLDTADPAYRLVLKGLTRDLEVGGWIPLTLNFERNGTKTVQVPVHTVPTRVAKKEGHYKIAETDSEGKPLPADDQRAESDHDGPEAPEGDSVVNDTHNSSGDNAGETPAEHR
ncbi:MAG: hypothetical protein M3P46_11220 [Actinomycetota bacterium]|nr:hypothetical protein [Actinomycetota bacterium]